MGAIRGVLLVFVAVLFFFSMIAVNLFWSLSLSLTYDNVQKQSIGIAQDILQQQNINLSNLIMQNYPLIQSYCQNNSNYVFNYGGYALDIPCNASLQGGNAIVNEGIKSLIRSIYYTKYECNFINCASQSAIPLFLVSEKAYTFWKENFYLSLIVAFILFLLVFFLVEKKSNLFILAGSILIVSSLPFLKLDFLLSLFSNGIISKFLGIFFSQSYFVAIRILIAGIVLIIFGIVIDVFKIGFWISNFFSKFKKRKEKRQKQKKSKSK